MSEALRATAGSSHFGSDVRGPVSSRASHECGHDAPDRRSAVMPCQWRSVLAS